MRERTCPICSKAFVAVQGHQEFCSVDCRIRSRAEKKRDKRADRNKLKNYGRRLAWGFVTMDVRDAVACSFIERY